MIGTQAKTIRGMIVKLRKQGYTIREIQTGLNLSTPSLVHYHLKKYNEKLDKKTLVFEALGEVSALFMTQDIKGTKMVMPSRELERIGNRIFKIIK